MIQRTLKSNDKEGKSRAAEFQSLVSEHLDALYGFALSLTRRKDKAEDLVQEACLKAYRFFDQFEKGTNMKAWLFKILKNTFLSHWRKEKKTPESVPFEDLSDFSFYREAHLQTRESPETFVGLESLSDIGMENFFGDEIMNSLNLLPVEFREVIFMCDIQGFSYGEIAKILNVPIGTVRSRLARGRGLMQKHLWDYAQEKGILRRRSS